MTALSIRELASRHWFYLLLPVWLAVLVLARCVYVEPATASG